MPAFADVGPSMHQHETEIGYNMIDAAVDESRKGNFKHFVLSSVIYTQLRKLMNHDCKRYEEEYLIESGLNFTILQPTHFMMFPVVPMMQQEKPVYPAAFDPNVTFSYMALQDLGEAAAKVLMEGQKHYFAQYPLVSDGPFSYTKVAEIVGEEIGKSITVKQRPFEEAVPALIEMVSGTADVHATTRDTYERLIL